MLGPRGRDGGLKEGQKLRVLLSPVRGPSAMQPVRVMLVGDTAIEAVVALSDWANMSAVDVQSAETKVAEPPTTDEEDDGSGVRLYQSIYETALRNQIPRPVIEELIRIYSYDVDFQRKAQPGDSFEVLYAGEDESGDGKPDVLFASLTVGGETKKFYRYQYPRRRHRRLLRRDRQEREEVPGAQAGRRRPSCAPASARAVIRSSATPRCTPASTGRRRWARRSTPPATARSRRSGWEGGYGKYIRIRHTNGYETAYGHMTAFARGMEPGTRVRQGQVIGYVGSTGLSTGAHVHYEILVNGRFVDPMRIKLPRGRVLEGPVLAGSSMSATGSTG